MNILVCLKQILDPDIPARDFRIDSERLEAERGAADLVANIFCENALETALQLRESAAEPVKITVLSYGTEEAEDALRKALAMRADEAVLVLGDGVDPPDGASVARVLAAAISKAGDFDLIMTGRESGDWGTGQTGGLLAEELGLPFVGFVDQVEATDDGLRLRRQTDAGTEILHAAPPLVVSVTNCDANLPRIPKTRDVMKSYRKPLTTLTLEDLDLASDADGSAACELVELFVPEKETHCELVEGDSLEAKVDAFARRVAEVMDAVG